MDYIKSKKFRETLFQSVAMSGITFTILWVKFEIFWAFSLGLSLIPGGITYALVNMNKTYQTVVWISLIKLTGPQSRIVMLSLISGLLLSGPTLSIVHNLHEVHTTTKCVADSVQNHSQELQQAYSSAYEDVSHTITNSVQVWKNVGSRIETVTGPLRRSFTTASQAVENVQNKVREVYGKCKNALGSAHSQCQSGSNRAYNDCRSKLPPFVNNVCEAVRVGNHVCSPLSSSDELCKPLEVAQSVPGLPDILGGLQQLVGFFTFSIQPKSDVVGNVNSSSGNISEAFSNIRDDFQQKFDHFRKIVKFLEILTLIPLLLVPFLSHKYLAGARGAAMAGNNKKLETFFTKDSKKERRGIGSQVLLLLTHGLLSAATFSLDYLLYWTQNVAKEHGSANFSAIGSIQIDLNVKVGPVFQPLVNTFIETLSHEKSYDFELTNVKCLPDPMTPSDGAGLRIGIFVGVLYLLALLTFILQTFTGLIKRRVVQRFLNEELGLASVNYVVDDGTSGEITYKVNNDTGDKLEKVGLFPERSTDEKAKINVKDINKFNKNFNEGY